MTERDGLHGPEDHSKRPWFLITSFIVVPLLVALIPILVATHKDGSPSPAQSSAPSVTVSPIPSTSYPPVPPTSVSTFQVAYQNKPLNLNIQGSTKLTGMCS